MPYTLGVTSRSVIVILLRMLYRLFTYEFGNAKMVQSGDEIIYFSRQPDDIFVHKKADEIIYLLWMSLTSVMTVS